MTYKFLQDKRPSWLRRFNNIPWPSLKSISHTQSFVVAIKFKILVVKSQSEEGTVLEKAHYCMISVWLDNAWEQTKSFIKSGLIGSPSANPSWQTCPDYFQSNFSSSLRNVAIEVRKLMISHSGAHEFQPGQLISSHLDSKHACREEGRVQCTELSYIRQAASATLLRNHTVLFCILSLDLYCMHRPICPHCCCVEARIVLFEFGARRDAKKLPNYQMDQNSVNWEAMS